MDPANHERVRAVFARAVELRQDERARFVEGACGDDPEVIREVQSLLEHHFAESIVKEPSPPALVLADTGSTEPGSRLRLLLRPGYRRAAIAAALLGLVLLGWWTHARVEAALLRMRAAELENVLASKADALEIWVRGQ